MTTEQMEAAEKLVKEVENMYFTGSFSERSIKDDLESRKLRDQYSTMGSNPYQTNTLFEKKRVYMKYFDDNEGGINMVLSFKENLKPELISKCEKCKKEIARLRNLVQNFS